MQRYEEAGENKVSDRRKQQDYAVQRDRPRGEMILAHPTGDERRERQPEQQVQICPQHATVDMLHRLKQVMVIAPVDAEKNETQHIAEENRGYRNQRGQRRFARHFQFQHQDGDDHRNHPIAERFHAALGHTKV